MGRFQSISARLVASTALSAETRHLDFEVTSEPRLGFVPGQWLSVTVDPPDGNPVTRAYSIASPPSDDGRFSLCVNRVEGGVVSNHLCDMPVGGGMTCEGPFGSFILRPPAADTLLIATGTGIAPFRSMLHWLFGHPGRLEGHDVWLLFGSRTESELYYHGEFTALAGSHPQFHYLPTLSRAGVAWQGLKGRVQEHVDAILRGRADSIRVYVCGLREMVTETRERLEHLGVGRKSIAFEKYD